MNQIILNANALDLDPGTINADAMICDPPYRSHVHRSAVSQSRKGGVRIRDLGFNCMAAPLRRQLGRFASAVRHWSVIYSDVESAAWIRLSAQAAGATYIRTVPWVRWSMPQLSGDRPPTGLELLTVTWGQAKGRKHWNGPGNLTHLAHKCLRGEDKHRAEKPLDQMLDLVNWFSDPGWVVFDPCAGSGTVGVACALLGRSYVGLEIDPNWADFADKRIQAAKLGTLSERDLERFKRWEAEPTDQSPYMKGKATKQPAG